MLPFMHNEDTNYCPRTLSIISSSLPQQHCMTPWAGGIGQVHRVKENIACLPRMEYVGAYVPCLRMCFFSASELIAKTLQDYIARAALCQVVAEPIQENLH